jgi:hypothetical protein
MVTILVSLKSEKCQSDGGLYFISENINATVYQVRH